MKKIAIYGAGRFGGQVQKNIDGASNLYKVCCFIDENYKKIYSKAGIPVVGIDEYMRHFDSQTELILVSAMNEDFRQEMILALLERHLREKIMVVDPNVFSGSLPVVDASGALVNVFTLNQVKPWLTYIEFHLCDSCNLKCKGCGHSSNIITKPNFPNLEVFEESLGGLKDRFSDIKRFRFMGGEPLLNKDIDKFLYVFRRYFPKADVFVVSNGLLLTKMPEYVTDAFYENNVVVQLSQYKPTREISAELIQFAHDRNFRLQISSLVELFFRRVFTGEETDVVSWHNCVSRKCHFLYGHMLGRCPKTILGTIVHQENYKFPAEVARETVIRSNYDIVNGKEDGWDIVLDFEKPHPLCKYCGSGTEWFEWESEAGI